MNGRALIVGLVFALAGIFSDDGLGGFIAAVVIGTIAFLLLDAWFQDRRG